jgi:hypothetical protein
MRGTGQDDLNAPPSRVRWLHVVTYYVFACAISWPFFWWRDMRPESWEAWRVPGFLKTATYMWGPGLSALICLSLFRGTHRRTVRVFGSSRWRSLVFYLAPLLALAAVESFQAPGPALPLLAAAFSFFTIFGEELGWRGFLQDALRPLPRRWRYLLIGTLWEAWHFTNRTHEGPLRAIAFRVTLFLIFCTVFSWLIGEAVDRSGSLLVAHTLHLWADYFADDASVSAIVVFTCAVLLWIGLLFRWKSHATSPSRGPQPAPASS